MAQYIDKNVLVAEIERRQTEEVSYYENGSFASWTDENHYFTLEAIKSFINTLEVKEADLDKEIDNQIRLLNGVHTRENDTNWYKGPYSELVFFAKHFFELGIKAQKGK